MIETENNHSRMEGSIFGITIKRKKFPKWIKVPLISSHWGIEIHVELKDAIKRNGFMGQYHKRLTRLRP